MTLGSLVLDIGWFGLGYDPGPPPMLFAGPVRLAWIRGGVIEQFRSLKASMQALLDANAARRNRVMEALKDE